MLRRLAARLPRRSIRPAPPCGGRSAPARAPDAPSARAVCATRSGNAPGRRQLFRPFSHLKNLKIQTSTQTHSAPPPIRSRHSSPAAFGGSALTAARNRRFFVALRRVLGGGSAESVVYGGAFRGLSDARRGVSPRERRGNSGESRSMRRAPRGRTRTVDFARALRSVGAERIGRHTRARAAQQGARACARRAALRASTGGRATPRGKASIDRYTRSRARAALRRRLAARAARARRRCCASRFHSEGGPGGGPRRWR